MFYLSLVLGFGLFAFGFLNESASTSSASPNCGGQELAGQWLNTAKPEGSDVLSAHIQIPCTSAAAAAGLAGPTLTPKIELQLTVRCMHVLACDWPGVPAIWQKPEKRGDTALLSAHYDQTRFERLVTIEPTDDGKLRLTLTSRFKGLAVAPVKSVYTLERQKA
jgi:hypothetical protein